MTSELTLLSAFLVGLLGSTHCLGMCGGIVSALTFGVRADLRQSPRTLGPFLLAYNAGRIGSYTLAGLIAGAVGAGAFGVLPSNSTRWVVKLVTGGFMIALGLYLAGWWPGLQTLEKWGGVLWLRIEPLGRKLLPVDHPLKALAFGIVWGWLPCAWYTPCSPGHWPQALPGRAHRSCWPSASVLCPCCSASAPPPSGLRILYGARVCAKALG